MKKIVALSFLALTILAGSASADRDRGRRWKKDRRHQATWSGGVVVQTAPARRVYVQRQRPRVVRRPIYVQRPVIQYRYYNYRQRPALIVENQQPMVGYFWVAGQWQWTGYEWTWQPGHYQPDPNYVEPGYYDDGYGYGYGY